MFQKSKKNNVKLAFVLVVSLVLILSILCQHRTEAKKIPTLKVYFIDVGQGSSILVKSENKNTLIDTGDEKYYDKLDSFLSNNQINSIDQIVLTHNDPDHVGNVDRLIKTRKVGTVIQSKYGYKKNKSTKDVKELNSAISKYHIKTLRVKTGDKIDFGSNAKGTVLSPGKNYKKVNQTSIVIRLVYGKYSYLFTGDIYSSNESELIKKFNVRSTVLQIPHHGSYTSSSEAFLKKVNAKYAVISCGKNNPYNHPRPEAMRRIKKYISNKNLYRTDQDGTILFSNDTKKLTIQLK